MLRSFAPLAVLVLALTVGACGSTKTPDQVRRDTARAAVLLVARGVAAADHVCAEVVVRERKDAANGRKCAAAYDVARPVLLTLEASIDAWDAKTAACAVRDAVRAIDTMRDAANAAGATVPSIVDDAVSLGGEFARGCP